MSTTKKAPAKKKPGKTLDEFYESNPELLDEKKRKVRPPNPRACGQITAQVVDDLSDALNHRETSHGNPKLSEMDRLVFCVISAGGQWVLVDRHQMLPKKPDGKSADGSSARYIGLRRRGFQVGVRHMDGVKNFWARWPHGDPEMPGVTAFDFDDEFTTYGGKISAGM